MFAEVEGIKSGGVCVMSLEMGVMEGNLLSEGAERLRRVGDGRVCCVDDLFGHVERR